MRIVVSNYTTPCEDYADEYASHCGNTNDYRVLVHLTKEANIWKRIDLESHVELKTQY